MSIDLKNQKCQACSGNTSTFDEKQIIEHLAKLNNCINCPYVMMELLTAIKRSGSDLIISYHSKEIIKLLNEKYS